MRSAVTDEIRPLIANIERDPDPLHSDVTPAVLKLVAHKLDGALAACEAMNSPSAATRYRAQRAIEGAVGLYFGRAFGQPFPDAATEQRIHDVISSSGYDADAPETQ